jgi:hypothetical protein
MVILLALMILEHGVSIRGICILAALFFLVGVVPALAGSLVEWDHYLGNLAFIAVALMLHGKYAHQAFYEAAAQIIPVLFLALAVTSRLSMLGAPLVADQNARMAIVIALVFGEAASIQALAEGDSRPFSFGVVIGSMLAATVPLIIHAIANPSAQETEKSEAHRRTARY